MAKFEGADPALKDEYVVYTAHWDHFGKTAEGIFHGARDNASGTGGARRDGAGVYEGVTAAEAIDPVPGGDRRGAGAARIAVSTR